MNNSDLKERIEALLEEINTTHRYSMSHIYGLYNEAFGTNEKSQSCSSCLIRKARELKAWLNTQNTVEEKAEPIEQEATTKKKRKHATPKD